MRRATGEHKNIETEVSDLLSRPVSEQLRSVFGIEGYKTDSETEKYSEECILAIRQFLERELIPKTYRLSAPETDEDRERTRKILGRSFPGYSSKPRKAIELFILGSLLLGRKIDTEQVGDDLKKAFTGRKVLVLGDDIGGMSEIVNLLGGTAYGIEHDESKVEIAQSGKLAESSQPQMQVIDGDILDLTDENSELMKKLSQLGLFDVICSDAVFNGGSGIEKSAAVYTSKKRTAKGKDLLFTGKVLDNTDRILADNGIHLHVNVDSDVDYTTNTQWLNIKQASGF